MCYPASFFYNIEYNVGDILRLLEFKFGLLLFGLGCFGIEVLWFDWGRSLVLGTQVKVQDLKKENRRQEESFSAT